jgi:uncharacterized protein
MATVTIRIDDDTREDLEEIAHTRGVTLSDLLRDQIDDLLGRGVPMRDDVPHALSPQQRLLLAQHHEILALLHADDDYESHHHRDMAEVLREGYAGEYGEVFAGIYSEVSRSECKLLWDILQMFRMLEVSIDRLSADDRTALGEDCERRLRFAGFDLNDSRECRMLTYVRYLVDRRRWTEIKPRLAEIGDEGNSHSPRLATYERMLDAYTPIFDLIAQGTRGYSRDDQMLSLDDLMQVAKAWVHPSRRS